MNYTRIQLEQAIQARNDLIKEMFKLHPIVATLTVAAVLGVAVGIAAGIGALAGLALSSVSFPPLIAGGIIGFAASLVSFVTKVCRGFHEPILEDIEAGMSEEHKRILREYSNSTECKVKSCVSGIAEIAFSFGIGASLVALGFSSPAAIGAVTAIAAIVVCYPLGLLTDKAIECFFPDENKQPDSLVNNMKIDGTGKDLSPYPSN